MSFPSLTFLFEQYPHFPLEPPCSGTISCFDQQIFKYIILKKELWNDKQWRLMTAPEAHHLLCMTQLAVLYLPFRRYSLVFAKSTQAS